MNWSRENCRSSVRASALASTVLPTPGTSSTSTWPSASRQRSGRRSVSRGACITVASPATTRSARSAAAVGGRCLSRRRSLHQRPSNSRSTSSSTATAMAGFGACGTSRSPSRGDQGDLVVGAVEADVGASHIVVDDEIDVLVVQHRPLALEPVRTVLGAERDEHLIGAPARAERLRDVGGRGQLDLPLAAVLRPLAVDRRRRRGSRRPPPPSGSRPRRCAPAPHARDRQPSGSRRPRRRAAAGR